MGWWSAPDVNDVEVGDEVLDEMRHLLVGVGKIYRREVGRNPKISELEYALNLVLKANADSDVLSNFESMEVRDLVIKVAKRPKRVKVKPGDIFSFRIDGGRFGFGQVVSLVSIGAVVQLLNYFSSQPIFDFSQRKNLLGAPITIGTYSLFEAKTEGDWRVIAEEKEFSPGLCYKDTRFIYGDEGDGFFTAVDIFDKETKVSVQEARSLPFYSIRGEDDVKEYVESALKRS
jgi:hypothetical protein